MAIEVPEGVQGLFLVLTGEKWPTANEDALREVGNAWGTAGDRLENELAPYMLQAVQKIRANFTGKSAIKFADMMAPYVVDQPRYIPQAAAQFQQLKKFLLDAATQVEYVKIISIEELVLLIAQIAWAIAMAFWTDGASMTWLAARMAIVRFLLKTWWGRLVLQFILAELFGIAFQVALDVLTQAIQFAKGTRTSWDVHATISAVEVGAIGGLLSLPFSAIGHFLSHQLTNGLTRLLGREVSATTLQPVVVRAVNGAARNLGKDTPIPKAAKSITENLFRAADKPLRIRLTEIGVPAIIEMTEEGLHEAITEGVVMAANGQGFQFNPFSFTSGVASSIATQSGHGIGGRLAGPKPVREGYTALGDGGHGDEGDDRAPSPAGDISDTDSFADDAPLLGHFDEDTTTAVSTPATSPASSPPSTRPSSPSPGDGTSRNTTQPPASTTPPRDTGSRSDSATGVSRNGSSPTRASQTSPRDTGSRTGPATGVSRNGSSSTRDSQARPPVSPEDTPSRTGLTSPATSVPSSRERTSTDASESTAATRSSTGTPGSFTREDQGGQKTTSSTSSASSRDPFREGGRSATTPPSTTRTSANGTGSEEATAGAGQGTGGRSNDRTTTNQGGPSRSQTRIPGNTGPANDRTTSDRTTSDRTTSDRTAGDQGGNERSPQRQTNPFRARMEERARAASSGEGTARSELPAEVIDDATVVPAAQLASLDISHVPLARRLVVDAAEGEVLPAHEVQAAADRIRVEVVARVDRAQVGNGRRKGVQWMSFPGNGGRPRPVQVPGPITPPWSHTPLSDAEFRSAYPWLPDINPMYTTGGDFLTNCLLAAIGVEFTLEEARQNPGVRPAQLHYYQVPPERQAPYDHLANMGRGDPVDVSGYQAVEHAMKAAGDGARGMLLVGRSGNDVDHVFNVVNRNGRIVYLDGQKGEQATLPERFRSLQFLPTSEGFPRGAIAERSTPWPHGAYIGSDQPPATEGTGDGADFVETLPWGRPPTDDSRGRYPFAGRGEVLGKGDGTGGIPGIGPETRKKWAEEKADAQKKAATGGKAERKRAGPRRGGRGRGGNTPATINDLPAEPVEERPRTTPFSGPGQTLGEGDGASGIPGVDPETRKKWAEEKAAAEQKTEKRATPPRTARPPRSGKGHGGDPMTVADLPETAPPKFPGVGRTTGTGTGTGGIRRLSQSERARWFAERRKRLAARDGERTGRGTEPFSGSGHRLGEEDAQGAGIKGLDNDVRAESAAERAEKDRQRAEQGRPPARSARVRPRRTGKGYDGDPMTFADLPPESSPAERPAPFSGTGHKLGEDDGKGTGIAGLTEEDHRRAEAARAAKTAGGAPTVSPRRTGKGYDGDPMTADDPPTERPAQEREQFPGDGEVLGKGDGKGTGIPGLDNETREKARAERAKRGDPPAGPVRLRPAPKEPVTLKDLRDAESKGGEGTAGTGTHGTVGTRNGNGTMTVLEQPERVAEEGRAATTDKPPATTGTERPRTERTPKAPGRKADRAERDEPPPPYAATTPDTTKVASADVRPGTRPPASRAGEPQSTPDPALADARTTLNELDPKRRAEALNEAQALVGDLSGLVPSARDEGGPVSRADRAGLLVAAAIAHSGRPAGETLARELARKGLHEPPPQPVPRVTVDHERLDVARTTLDLVKKASEDHYAQVLEEARLIVKHLVGTNPSPFATRGKARRLALVWLLTAAEIPWAGHQAAENLAADILGLPRSSTSGVRSRHVTGLASAARNDPGRARTTLGLMSDARAEGFLNEADTILREATVQTPVPPAGGRARRLLVAAELARSGRRAGTELARALVAEAARKGASARAKTSSGPRKQVRFADEVTVHDETEDALEHEHGVEDERDVSEAAERTPDTEPRSPAPSPMRVEDVIRNTRVGMVGDQVVAIWLPGAPKTGPAFDAKTLTRLGRLAPEGMVLVFGSVHDGRVTAGEREISVDALAAVIAGKAPAMKPFLLMSGGASVAEPLSRALDEPVLATPHEVGYDAETGDVVSRRPGGTTDGTTPEEDWFRVFSPGDEGGTPILMALFDGAREGWRRQDGDPDPDPDPHSSSSVGRSEDRKDDDRPTAPPRPPNGPLPPQPVATPIAADPMIRSIGVPRAGLPRQPELLASIRAELDAAGVRYNENELNLLAHRMLANYPYLLGDDAPNGTNGLQVPIGDAELLISLEATDPHTLNNPAGSTLTPSQLPPVEGEHHAVDTINATYATGAHVQTQAGQTGATRGALSLTFGIGVGPGVLQVVKVGGSISGTTNQSNRSDTHIADAEGGHVEDNRTEARLVSYMPKWSFKLRTDANQSWTTTDVHRLDGRTDERLLLWIPGHYLDTPAPDQVTATGAAVKTRNLPPFFSASGLTNIPRLFDEIVATLRGQGLDLPMGSMIRQELLQKLWNLNAHLDEAVNTARGYRITLHNKYGRPVATVAVRSERLAAAPRVGATSDKAHIENVRTAIDGTSGGHNITNSSTLTFPSLEFDLLPNPLGLPDVGLGVSTSLGFTSSNVDGISTGRVGLNVLVPRNTSHTAAYHMSFSHRATVSVRKGDRRDAPRTTRPVRGGALVRMPEAAAYEHGFAVDREALKRPPAHGGTRPYAPDAIRNTGVRKGDPATKPVPQYVADGKGVGMGLVMVADGTVQALQQRVKDELRGRGFLPADDEDPFAGYSWYGHGNKTDSLIDNLELVEKMVSSRGLDSHYDQIHQDGMTFTLRKRRGGAGVDWDVDSAKVTITATPHTAKPPRFIRSTNEFHTVNLAMGMDSAGMSVSHSRKLAWGVKLRGTFKVLKAALMGIEFQRIVGASDSLNFLNNRPELLEYPGDVDEFALTSDYHIRIEYQHSGRQGKIRKGSRDPAVTHVADQTAQAYLLPLGAGPQQGPRSAGPTPAEVLDQGVVYFLDTTGVRDAIEALGDMADPAGTASSIRDTYASTIELRSHLKEILQGEYTTDRPFEPGLFRDTFGAMDIRGEMGPSMFTGATNDKFVLGIIKLWLAENRLTDTSSAGWTWDQLDVAAGGDAGHATLVGETDVNRHWQHNRSKGSGRTGGKELIQLDFNRVYSYRSTVNLTVRSLREKHSKLLPSGSPRYRPVPVPGRGMVYLLPEPEALTRYAEGVLPVSDAQLKDAMLRWRNGRLKLSGDVVAKILMRWNKEVPGLPRETRVSRVRLARALARMHGTGTVRILDDDVRRDFNATFGHSLENPASLYLRPRMPADVVAYAEGHGPSLTGPRLVQVLAGWHDGTVRLSGDVVARTLMRWHAEAPVLPGTFQHGRGVLVGTLAHRHRTGGAPIDSLEVRERFNQAFRQNLSNPPRPYHLMEMPEYLTRDDPNGRVLGHSGVHDLDYDDHRSTYQIVREQIEQVAPGMLAAGAEIWDGRGRRIGRMQGGVDALQSILARGRDQAMWEDVLAKGGYSLYLVNPVGWFLTDVVEVNLADVLTSAPEVHDFKPDTGLENYGHGYIATARSKSRDGSQAWVFPKFSPGGDRASGPVDLKAAEGHHRGTTRAENAVSEQTVYDWSGHYRVRFRHRLTVRVQRLRMPGRPLNNLLLKSFGKWTRHGRTSEVVARGTLNLQVPRALAEAGRQHGPEQVRDIVPLPKLPGNAYVTGAMIDDLLPAGRKMLGEMFGPRWYEKALGARANDPKTRSSLSLPVLLSRSHLTNHVREATGGDRYKLADDLFIPGDSSERARVWMQGDLFDAQVVGRMSDGGTGTGRYIKHQSGTTVNNSSDLGRVIGEYAVNGNDTIHPQNLPADAPPHRPDHDWEFNHSGNRTTSANQNSSGTENYRREQHAKELGSTLLIRMRGRFWLEAQKTRHHLLRKSHDVGDPVRSDPVTGDVYVEMFEAQYEELLAQMAANTRQAQVALQERVDPTAWWGMDDAPRFDLHTLLVDAGRNGLDATRAHHGVVRHIRERAGGNGRLALRFGRQAEVLRYRAMLNWAIRTIEEDLRTARAVDPTVAIPPSLARYRGYRAADGIPGGLPHPVADEITAMIHEVNRIHDLSPDNPLGAPAALPPEASLLSMDPVHLARDVANELNAHVRLDIEDPGGATVRRWVDPAGRIYAFDPATFNDVTLTAHRATRAGLWSDEIRREALAHGLGPLDLGRFYRTSWADQRTFEQAVAAEIAERRARLEAAHRELPRMFDRALAAAEEWHAEVRRLELERAELARDITRAEDAVRRRNDQLSELDGERFALSLEESPDRDALRRVAERTRTLETSRDRRRRRLDEHGRR
ncbi:WXG100-like domain-containing protein, partial [Actinoallomurus acaciae]